MIYFGIAETIILLSFFPQFKVTSLYIKSRKYSFLKKLENEGAQAIFIYQKYFDSRM